MLCPLYQASTPSWFGGSSCRLLRTSLSAGKFRRGQSVGSAAAPGPASVSRRALVKSHPLPKPLFFLNSLRPQPLRWQDLAACQGDSNLYSWKPALGSPTTHASQTAVAVGSETPGIRKPGGARRHPGELPGWRPRPPVPL